MITLDEARARGIHLPADDDVANDIIDEQEAWLAQRIGPLEGSRIETFLVGVGVSGRLGLRRFTDAVVVTDNGGTVDTALVNLVENGSAVERVVAGYPGYWTGPYVTVTSTPNDALEVRKALFDLLALSLEPVTALTSETMGAYSYSRPALSANSQAKAIIVSSLLPRRAGFAILPLTRDALYGDALVNRAELPT